MDAQWSLLLLVSLVESSFKVSELGVFLVKCSFGAGLCCSDNVLRAGAPVRAGHSSIKFNRLRISRSAAFLRQHPLRHRDLLHPLGITRKLVVGDPLRDVV